MEAEMKLAERKLELEAGAKANYSKLPELRVTQFKGTMSDLVRFENMFKTQVLNKGFNDEMNLATCWKWRIQKSEKRLQI